MSTQKFNEAQDKLITSAERLAGGYLLNKHGSAHLVGKPMVELTHRQDDKSSAFVFSGKITCHAADSLLNQIDVNMTVNENDIEVISEDVQANVTNALNAVEESHDVLLASLNGFKLTDDGSKYLKISHLDLNDSTLGVIGKSEYETSTDKAVLLKNIAKDAFVNSVVSFTGEFTEPTIIKKADDEDYCQECEKKVTGNGMYASCKSDLEHDAEAAQNIAQPKASWLTNELLKDAELDNINYEPGREVKEAADDFKGIQINEDMPHGKSADTLVQAAQAEDQTALEAQLKVEHEAANELLSLLQGMGYGSAKTIEVTSSKDRVDIMTAIDHDSAVRAVNIPVTVKEGKIILPNKTLLSTLISKGLDVRAKLMEQFDAELLEKLAAIDEKMTYEEKETQDILSEKQASVEKEAAGEKQPFFDSDDSTMTVNKFMLPNHEDLKVGDRLSDGTDSWEIVNEEGQQNDKNEGSSSQWTMKKVQNPEHDGKKPKNKIPS